MKNVKLLGPAVTQKRGGLRYSYIITVDGDEVGECNLRLGDPLEPYGGNVGYRIDEEFRGHRYSLSALELLRKEAKRLGFERIVICCDPNNFASRRIAELSGAEPLGIIDIPPDCELYAYGRRTSCRYIIELKS